jgi:hypothetical protein
VPTDLTADKDAGSLKNIIVLARKRPIQEGIVDKLDFSRVFGNYVTGQIEADFLDLDDGYEDIATSDRQRLIEDDERVTGLQKFLRGAFVKAADQWTNLRPKKEVADVFEKWPQIKDWVDGREPWQRGAAETMLGAVAALPLEAKAESTRVDLFRAGILAFERIGLRKVSEELDKLAQVSAPELLRLLGIQDAYESALWIDILRSRVEAISQFRNLTTADEKERVLQKHLFDHLWLVDPSWERAAGSQQMEENLRKVAPKVFATGEEGKEIFGRLDIRYATTGGKHVIVELKRYSVRPDISELKDQGLKYHKALSSILKKQQKPVNIELVFVLGDEPGTAARGIMSHEQYIEHELGPTINGRVALYDALIANAEHQYRDYLEASDKSRDLDKLLDSLGEPTK